MRIALIVVASKTSSSLDSWAASLAKGMEANGHRVDILNARTDDGMRLPGYEFIAVLAETNSVFSSKIPAAISKILGTASSLVGKKGVAFLRKGPLFGEKALCRVMQAMEAEGMRVNWSELLQSKEHAETVGKRTA